MNYLECGLKRQQSSCSHLASARKHGDGGNILRIIRWWPRLVWIRKAFYECRKSLFLCTWILSRFSFFSWLNLKKKSKEAGEKDTLSAEAQRLLVARRRTSDTVTKTVECFRAATTCRNPAHFQSHVKKNTIERTWKFRLKTENKWKTNKCTNT